MFLMTATFAVCILTIGFAGTGSQASSVFGCVADGAAASLACSDVMQKEISYYGKPYCCIAAKFKHCLTSQLKESCGRHVEYLVNAGMKNLLFNEDSGCKDFEYISAPCIVFYYRYQLLFGGLIFLLLLTCFIAYKLLSCCFTCVRDCVRACFRLATKSKCYDQLPLSPAGEPLIVTASQRTIYPYHLPSTPAHQRF